MALPSRQFLLAEVFPWMIRHCRCILFVGAAPYTYHYQTIFRRAGVRFVTMDVDAGARIWGAQEHIQAPVQEVDRRFAPEEFDGVVLNGVFGFGIDSPLEMNRTLAAVARVLRPGGLLLLGWNTDRTASPLELEESARWYTPVANLPFPPRRTFAGETHVYDFLQRRPDPISLPMPKNPSSSSTHP